MTRPVEFHPAADLEVSEAHRWYAERDEHAAARFRAALDKAVQAAAEAPEQWPVYLLGTRRLLLRRFPFLLVFRVDSSRILILDVAHERRRPGYWRKRRGPGAR